MLERLVILLVICIFQVCTLYSLFTFIEIGKRPIFIKLSISFLGYNLPWEEKNLQYPNNMASPLEIIIEASNGASDYGNKFGEPVISGFARSFGMTDEVGVRREWIKPIMFSGGLGTMDANMSQKILPQKGE